MLGLAGDVPKNDKPKGGVKGNGNLNEPESYNRGNVDDDHQIALQKLNKKYKTDLQVTLQNGEYLIKGTKGIKFSDLDEYLDELADIYNEDIEFDITEMRFKINQ
jgi:hypothetical protein